MSVEKLTQDAVLRIGEVCGVQGRKIYVLVDKEKNLSDMFLDGDILKNVSVNSDQPRHNWTTFHVRVSTTRRDP